MAAALGAAGVAASFGSNEAASDDMERDDVRETEDMLMHMKEDHPELGLK